MKSSSFKFLTLMSLLAMANATFAASTWDLDGACGTAGNGGETTDANGNAYLTTGACGNGSNSGTTLNVGGWSTTSGTGAAVNTTFAAATVYDWGTWGLGVVNVKENSNDTGPHATDNSIGTDTFLLKFGAAVNLTGLNIGWNGTDNATTTNGVAYKDSDLSVLAWTGTTAPPVLANQSIPNLIANGWKLIGNYADVGVNANNAQTLNATNANGTALYSSYWMVSAYNPLYGGTKVDAYGETSSPTPNVQFVDAFKLLMLAADPCTGGTVGTNNQCTTNVPEPGGLVLLAAGLVGLVATRRRKPIDAALSV